MHHGPRDPQTSDPAVPQICELASRTGVGAEVVNSLIDRGVSVGEAREEKSGSQKRTL